MESDQDISDLRREVAGLRWCVFIGAGGVLVVLALVNLFLVSSLPGGVVSWEKILEDMLGSTTKLPLATQWALNYGRAAGRLLPTALIISFTLAVLAFMNVMRFSWKFALVAVIAALMLVAHAGFILLGEYIAFMQIVAGIGGSSV
jgi:hypothetical protein